MFLQELKFSTEVQRKYLDAQSRARFHFGAEVERYLEQLRREMIHSDVFDRYGPPQGALAAQAQGTMDEQVARLDRLNAFYPEIDRMFVPYMRLDQRMPLWWWRPFTTRICNRASGIAANIAKLPEFLRR